MFKYIGREKEYLREYRKIHPKKLDGKCKCIICKNDFKVEKYREKIAKFCSYSCYWKYLKGKPNPILKNYGKTRIGKKNPFFNKKHTIKTKNLISNSRIGKCCGELNPNWNNGSSFEEYSKNFNTDLKEKIRKRDNYQCQNKECNMTEEEHLIVFGKNLTVHHIDYNKKNSQEDNLISLCNQCNLRVNYNRPYWIEYFKSVNVEYVCGEDKL